MILTNMLLGFHPMHNLQIHAGAIGKLLYGL